MIPLYAEPPLAVARVCDPVGLRRGRALLLELAFDLRTELGVDPCAADVSLRAALADPVGAFVHGRQALLVATDSGRDVGVAVVLAHHDGTAELRHLYVRVDARRAGVGRALMQAAIVHSKAAGHTSLWADPITGVPESVHALGQSFGWRKGDNAAAALALTPSRS